MKLYTFQKQKLLIVAFMLALLILITPLIVLKIGPGGYRHYGPDVPDIYIYGGFITGKDTGFWGINFVCKFQLIFIGIFMLNAISTILLQTKRQLSIIFTILNSILLLLFPVWLMLYVQGVINNSDSADLTIIPYPGLILYLLLVLIYWNLIRRVSKREKGARINEL